MSYTLEYHKAQATLTAHFAGQVSVDSLEAALQESSHYVLSLGQASGYILDWREADSLDQHHGPFIVAVIGAWLEDLHAQQPTYAVWVTSADAVKQAVHWIELNTLNLPVYSDLDAAFSYLSLKISGRRIKDSMGETNALGSQMRQQLYESLQRGGLELPSLPTTLPEEADETSRVMVGSVVRLVSMDLDRAVLLTPGRSCVLGRRDSSGQKPDVDLSLWAGAQGGISRQHAELRQSEDGIVYLRDLGSTNGTFINGQRLTAQREYRVESGAELQFGNLILKINFGTGDLQR
jgi:pSer/pThr/pTyr-binding forkhead associated (FHA) protein